MPRRIFLANVGSNASHRFCSPVFSDGTFEFIPIPEDQALPEEHAITFKNLRSFYNQTLRLTNYIPQRFWDWTAHNDPEFRTFTYGDNCEINSRASSLKSISKGDFLFFIARLQRWENNIPTNEFGFYLIGFLEIEEVLKEVIEHPDNAILQRFKENAHIRRGLGYPNLWDRFWIFRGSKKSRRFYTALKVDRLMAQNVFRSADGTPWRWGHGRTDLQVIGSYTRSCRCVIDPEKSKDALRASIFWSYINKHS